MALHQAKGKLIGVIGDEVSIDHVKIMPCIKK